MGARRRLVGLWIHDMAGQYTKLACIQARELKTAQELHYLYSKRRNIQWIILGNHFQSVFYISVPSSLVIKLCNNDLKLERPAKEPRLDPGEKSLTVYLDIQ